MSVRPDALWVQGAEAGPTAAASPTTRARRRRCRCSSWSPDVRAETDLPLVGAGGLMDGADVAAALAAGATWAGLGTAFLGCPEAGTHPTYLAALTDPRFDRDGDDPGLHRTVGARTGQHFPAVSTTPRRRAATRRCTT